MARFVDTVYDNALVLNALSH